MNKSNLPPTILVIFGLTGDLGKRYLLPALAHIAESGHAPAAFHMLGITRQDLDANTVLAAGADQKSAGYDFLKDHFEMYKMDLTNPDDYAQLGIKLSHAAQKLGDGTQILFYLSVPPQMSRPIIRFLGEAGLNGPNTKLLLEKPFGSDFTSAQEMINEIEQQFKEDQVYRIDHYLAKEMAQNLIVFRSSNALFKQTWSNDFIDSIEIIAAENIGIEGRAVFYEQTGALRDLVQSHLLQLLALVLMDLPAEDLHDIQAKRLAALNSLRLAGEAGQAVIRGQYDGYKDEVQTPHSSVETFVSLALESSLPQWQGVPIMLTTGKALSQKTTEINIYFRQNHKAEANRLTFRIQPNEGIELDLWSKDPGFERKLLPVKMTFDYAATGEQAAAYEHVLRDAMQTKKSLFSSSNEVMASWRLLQPILSHWDFTSSDLKIYKPGSTIESIVK